MPEYKQVELQDTTDEEVGVVATEKVETDPSDHDVAKNDNNVTTQVRVVAPASLPARYRLTVELDNGEEFQVLIPEGGVQQGQEFTADKLEVDLRPAPEFGDGLCDCGSEGGNVFLCAWLCAGVVFAAIMEKLKLNSCAERDYSGNSNNYKSTFYVVSTMFVIYMVLYLFAVASQGPNLGLPFLIYLIFVQTKTRMTVRDRYGIQGSCAEDCFSVWCCTCCSALQIHREMRRRGEASTRFGGWKAEATIV